VTDKQAAVRELYANTIRVHMDTMVHSVENDHFYDRKTPSREDTLKCIPESIHAMCDAIIDCVMVKQRRYQARAGIGQIQGLTIQQIQANANANAAHVTSVMASRASEETLCGVPNSIPPFPDPDAANDNTDIVFRSMREALLFAQRRRKCTLLHPAHFSPSLGTSRYHFP
jgi:hypothetical protein